ncbi:hypothetical protein ACH5Y9_05505 [Methylomonas sp. BW4-1]|uniref:hypothetical protein n=1 Tax=Methylomonas sp. BW4-1 TaxID=3376685 RepID=UPI0040414186
MSPAMTAFLIYLDICLFALGGFYLALLMTRMLAFGGVIFDWTLFNFPLKRLYEIESDWLFRLSSLWIGVHWSPYNKRLCINPLPCLTLWVVLPGGNAP